MRTLVWIVLWPVAGAMCAGQGRSELDKARDAQDRAALEGVIARLEEAAKTKSTIAGAQYRLALAQSYLAEVLLELGDKGKAKAAAEAGIRAAERAVALQPGSAEHHRILGTLCGQVIPANVLAGLRYGKCARQSIEKALELDPNSSQAHLSHGVGNYYLPPALGGGLEAAIRDFENAIRLNPQSADAHLWMGIALRKANRAAEARRAFEKSLSLNPERLRAKQLLERTAAE